MTFGPSGCPVVLVGNDAWHLKQGRIVRNLEGAYESRALRALSANGQFFAVADKLPNQKNTSVLVWNVVSQKQVHTIPGDAANFVDIIAFVENKQLLLGGRLSTELSVWDLETGTKSRTITVPTRRLATENFTVSPDGAHFACAGDDSVLVCSLSNGKVIATLAQPGAGDGSQVVARPNPARDPAGFQAALKSQLASRFTLASMRGLTFSPDGKEIVAVSMHPHAHLMCWASNGRLLLDEPLSAARLSMGKITVKWLPDGSGWLVNGNLFDRVSKQIVLSIRVPFAQEVLVQPLERRRWLGQFGTSGTLETLTVPWDKLDASLAQMKRKSPAYLAPGQPVSVKIELSNLRGNASETEQQLREAVVKRLERVGIPVKEGQSTTLMLKLAERAGDRLPIFERQSAFDFRGTDTGRTAVEAGGDLVIEVIAEGEASPLWRDTMQGSSSRSFREEINDITVRKSMLDHLARQLTDLAMPYYLPKSTDLMALPAIVE